ncbi:hypothetical protein D3C80_967620 [compost metagenome]
MAIVAGAGDQDEVGPQGARGPDHLIDFSRTIHGDDQGAGRFQAAGVQHLRAGCVAVIDLEAFDAAGADRGGVGVQGDEALVVLGQKFADQMSDPAEADDQDSAVGGQDGGVRRQALGLGFRGKGGALRQHPRQHRQQRHGEHAEGGGQHGLAGQFGRRQPLDHAGRQDDEGELAGRAQHQGRFDGRSRGQTPGAGQDEDDQGLQQDQSAGQAQHRRRIGGDGVQIQADADADEEDAEQQAFEGVDGHLDLAPELGLGQKHPGDQGAQTHRQADRLGRQP